MGGGGTRTTDSLFKDMLTLKTKVADTQQALAFDRYVPQEQAAASSARNDILQQFINSQQQTASPRRQGMLTDAKPTRRFPY